MHVVLMFTGLVSALLGLIMIAFGIPISAFEVGNLLITCGTIASVGGLLLVGIAGVLRQLHRLIDVLEARPLAGATPLPPDATILAGEPDADAISVGEEDVARHGGEASRREPEIGLSQSEARGFELDAGSRPFAPEIRSPTLAADEGPAAPPIVIERPPPAREPAHAAPPLRAHEPMLTPPTGSPSAAQQPAAPPPSMRPPPAPETPPAPPRREPMFRAGLRARTELGLSTRPEAAAPKGGPATVLKSGVIDGMAYTLYSDGSIDAELAQGTMKFGSIPELREYLNQHSRQH